MSASPSIATSRSLTQSGWPATALSWFENKYRGPRPSEFSRWSLRRQSEYATGRWLAAQALLDLGATEEEVLSSLGPSGDSGSPSWTSGYVGSLTHSQSENRTFIAEALVARRTHFRAAGLDLERIDRFENQPRLTAKIASVQEEALLHPWESSALRSAILFSAKESLYKALSPLTQRFHGFRAARAIDATQDRLLLELTENWSPQLPAGLRFEARYNRLGPEWIRTEVVVPA